jgi:hypothetical protein
MRISPLFLLHDIQICWPNGQCVQDHKTLDYCEEKGEEEQHSDDEPGPPQAPPVGREGGMIEL